MKKGLLKALKEIGILLLMLVILAAVTVLAFYKQVPFGKEIPGAEEYQVADSQKYSVTSTDRLQNINSVTITHETNNNQIVQAENDVRIETGKATPFGSIQGSTDLPAERVGSSVVIQNFDANSSTASGDISLLYPDTSEEEKSNTQTESDNSETQGNSTMAERKAENKSGD